MSDVPEKRAIISGIGISRIGRKTDIGHLELTTESSSAAIADAGLRPEDIDGIATMGETPVEEVEQHLGGRIGSVPMVGAAGLLAPVLGAFRAVANGDARHVLVYRTVKMMGGSILPPSGGTPAPPTPPRPRPDDEGGDGAEDDGQRHGRHGADAHVRRVLGRELARHARAAPHVPLRHHQGAARRAGRQQPEERGVQPTARCTASR